MNRKQYLSVPAVLIGTLILAILGTVAWVILLVPVMVKPSIITKISPADKITGYVMKRAMQSAMKGMPHP